MFYIFLSVCILLPVFMGFGRLTECLHGKLWDGISGNIFLGIVSLGTLFTLLAFFVPLNLYLELPVIAVGISAFFYFNLQKTLGKFLRENFKYFFISLVISLLFGSFFPFIFDHFGYYTPSIKWLAEIGLVKGISNLDLLLGQMSFWHILQAGFSNFSDPLLRLNTLIIVFYAIYIIEKKHWLHFLFFPVLLLFTQSPSPDLPGIVISLIVLNEIIITNKNTRLLLVLSVFVFAIKPTMIWLPVLTFLYSSFIVKSNPKYLISGIAVLGIYIFKNIWTFGYPVFPVSILDLNVAWKPNPEMLRISSEFAVKKTFDMQYSTEEISNFTPIYYVLNWFSLNGIKGVIHILFILMLLLVSFFTFKKNSLVHYFIWSAILFKTIIVLSFSAQYRFFLDLFFVVFFMMLYKFKNYTIILKISFVFTLFTLIIFSIPQLFQKAAPSFRLGKYMLGFHYHQLYTPGYFQFKKYNTYIIGNLKFNVVQKYPFSFDTPIPAISPEFLKEDYEAGIFPQKMGTDLRDGFIWRKLSEDEKIELKNILSQEIQ